MSVSCAVLSVLLLNSLFMFMKFSFKGGLSNGIEIIHCITTFISALARWLDQEDQVE